MSQEARPSDKQLVLEALRRMPSDASLQEIYEEVARLADLRQADDAAISVEVPYIRHAVAQVPEPPA